MTRGLARCAALAASCLLAACGTVPGSWTASVPTSGPIAEGQQVGIDREDQFIRVIARGPQDGMTPMQVVEGFLEASASFDGNQSVARQYLTAEAARRWDPSLGVAVHEGDAVLSSAGSAVTLRAVQAGTIDREGTYAVAEDGTDLVERFSLVRDGGQWRIDELPQGLVLSSADVDRAYRALNVYFFDPTFGTLVPDARMVPVLGSGAATTLMRMLLDGPSAWLAPAVRTAFPPGVGLGLATVPIEGGIARVDLDAAARAADDTVRQAMSQQIVWTLRQVPDVQSIEITAGRIPLDVPGVQSPQPRDAWPAVDPGGLRAGAAGYVLDPGVVELDPRPQVAGSEPADIPLALSGPPGSEAPELASLAVARDLDELAGVDVEGTLWRGPLEQGGRLVPVVPSCGCERLAFDRSGDVWTVVDGVGLVAYDEIGTGTRVQVLGLPAGSALVRAVPSRDGTRAALIVASDAGRTLLLGRIVRATPGAEARVTAPIRVEATLDDVLDVAWSGAGSLAVLAVVTGSAVQAYDVDLARGTVAALDGPGDPRAIAAAPGLPGLVSSADGSVYEFRGGDWLVRTEGTAPAYPS